MHNKQKIIQARKLRRQVRVRAKISGTPEIPRLAVYKSLGNIYAQVIDDTKGTTLAAVSDLGHESMKHKKIPKHEADQNKEQMSRKVNLAYLVGKALAVEAKKAGISKVVFDRGGFKYHGRIKALADGARTGGLKF